MGHGSMAGWLCTIRHHAITACTTEGCLKVQLCSQWFEKPNMKHETRYGILLLFYVLFFALHQSQAQVIFRKGQPILFTPPTRSWPGDERRTICIAAAE